MMNKITFTKEAWEEYLFFKQNDRKNSRKIDKLIKEILRTPYDNGAESLKYDLTGYYSRQIDKKNRLVFIIKEDTIAIIQLQYHYDDK